MQEEILKLEKEFELAIVRNDPEAIGQVLADDRTIIDPDEGVIDKSRFLGVISSGKLGHQAMDSDDVRVRVYGEWACVNALTTTRVKFLGQEFAGQEPATGMFVKKV